MDTYRGNAGVGVYVQYEGGHIEVPSYTGCGAFDKNGKLFKAFGSFKGTNDGTAVEKEDTGKQDSHHTNWSKAIRSRKPAQLNAEILDGHYSSALCHTANISIRLGKKQAPGAILEKVKANKEAADSYERMVEHLGKNGVDIAKDHLTLGEFLTMDPKTEKFVGNAAADKLLTRDYRKPYIVPDVA